MRVGCLLANAPAAVAECVDHLEQDRETRPRRWAILALKTATLHCIVAGIDPGLNPIAMVAYGNAPQEAE